MRFFVSLFVAVLFATTTSVALAQKEIAALEETAPLLFELEGSARVAGLGGAFLALSDDESAAYYNPAGLAFLEKRSIAVLYSRLFEVVDYLSLGAAIPLVGFHVIRLDSGSMPVHNAFGNPTDETTDFVSQAGMVAVGLAPVRELGLGGRVKAYQTQAGHWNGFGWAADAAALLRWSALRLGAVLENYLQQPIQYSDGSAQAWPKDLRVGAACFLEFRPLQLGFLLDATHLLTQTQWRAGVELWVQHLGIRLGYNGISLTAGASAYFQNFRLDWAYTLHPQLPTSYLMTVAYRF